MYPHLNYWMDFHHTGTLQEWDFGQVWWTFTKVVWTVSVCCLIKYPLYVGFIDIWCRLARASRQTKRQFYFDQQTWWNTRWWTPTMVGFCYFLCSEQTVLGSKAYILRQNKWSSVNKLSSCKGWPFTSLNKLPVK